MIERVSNWLNGKRNFNIGKVLFTQLCSDDTVLHQLQQGKNEHTEQLLAQALQQWCDNEIKKQTADKSVMPATDNEVLNAIRKDWLPLYKRMSYLCQTLDQFGTSNRAQAIAAREVIAFEILDLEKQCSIHWNKRDHYLTHGTLPQLAATNNDDVQLPSDPVEAARFIENIKRNIRRNKLQMQKKDAQPQYVFLFHHYTNLLKKLTGHEYKEKNNVRKIQTA